MTDSQSFLEISEAFLEFESEFKTFDIEIDAVPVWEWIRHDCHRSILESTGVTGQAHTSSTIDSTLDRYKQAIRSGITTMGRRNPYFTRSRDILVFGHQRRKQLDDGYWWDIYCDPIYEALDLDYIHLERQYKNTHLTPAKTDNLRYMDLIKNTARFCRKVGIGGSSVDEAELAPIRKLEAAIERRFGAEIDLVDSVRYLLALRRPLLRLYDQLLSRVDPDVILILVSYGRETFIEACKGRDIPVAELQHGIIHPYHFGYAFPDERIKTMFPDYLFTFGDYWTNAVEYPIPDENVIAVGYPYLEMRLEKYYRDCPKKQILFLSQGTIGEQLSRFAIEMANDSRIDYELVYKLHPGEYNRWKTEYPWLLDSDIKVVDTSTPPLYQLFSESSVQVGVSSTAVYEGLAFDLDTYVYECPDSEILRPLIENGAATKIATTDQFVNQDGSTGRGGQETNYYFKENSVENITSELNRLLTTRT